MDRLSILEQYKNALRNQHRNALKWEMRTAEGQSQCLLCSTRSESMNVELYELRLAQESRPFNQMIPCQGHLEQFVAMTVECAYRRTDIFERVFCTANDSLLIIALIDAYLKRYGMDSNQIINCLCFQSLLRAFLDSNPFEESDDIRLANRLRLLVLYFIAAALPSLYLKIHSAQLIEQIVSQIDRPAARRLTAFLLTNPIIPRFIKIHTTSTVLSHVYPLRRVVSIEQIDGFSEIFQVLCSLPLDNSLREELQTRVACYQCQQMLLE